jgi:hypothetical protein
VEGCVIMSKSIPDLGQMLAEDIESKAEWRNAVAEVHPEDERNRHAAEGLHRLASYVRKLPDDPRLTAIDKA